MKKVRHLSGTDIVYPNGRTIHSLVKKFPVFDEKNNLIAIAGISVILLIIKKPSKIFQKVRKDSIPD